MDATTLTLIILGIIALLILILVLIYLVALIRRTNIIMKKVDYLVEDVTYKSESLSIAVDAVNKISNYVLSFDTIMKKNLKTLFRLISENRNFIYSFIDKLKEDLGENLKTKKTASPKKSGTKKSKTKKAKSKQTESKTTKTKEGAKK